MKHSQARLRALAVIAASAGFILLLSYGIRTNNSPRMPHLASSADRVGVTLRAIDGGSNYFTTKSPRSRWLDGRMLLGSWLEQPQSSAEVGYDTAAGENVYWSLAGKPGDDRVEYGVIRAAGMHVFAPDTDAATGSETIGFDGGDESDMDYGPGSNGWSPKSSVYNTSACVPSGSQCGYTAANFFYTGSPTTYGSPGYTPDGSAVHQGYGKGVLFWESDSQAAKFMNYSDVLSADSYWMTDPDLSVASQGGCALFPSSTTICNGGGGAGLSTAQRALPANYAFNVLRMEQLQKMSGGSKPVVVDVETGCPFTNTNCITPPAMKAAAMHAIVAGARGIVWFQHNFGGQCPDFRTIIDGSNPASSRYNCQQTPGVTIHDVVTNITQFDSLVDSLTAVLTSPFADGYVSTTATVSTMAKFDGTNYYVFAASGKPGTPPSANQNVTLNLTGTSDGSVTVIGENRTLALAGGKFSDTFVDANAYHVYRINAAGTPVPTSTSTPTSRVGTRPPLHRARTS